MQPFLLRVAERDVDPRPTHQPVASQLHCSAALSADSNFSRAKSFNSSYSLTLRTWRSLFPNSLWAWSATGTGRRTLWGSASGKIRRYGDKYFKPAKHFDDDGDKCNPIPMQFDIQMHISKTRTWSWAWGILKIYRLKIVSLKFCKKEETLRKCATMKKIHSFGYLFINI